MMLEHQKALNDAERRVQEAEQRAVYRLETTSPVKVQGSPRVVECIARAASIQPSTLGNSHSRSGLESNDLKLSDCYPHQGQIPVGQISGGQRKSRLRRQKKLPLLEIAEHEA